MDRRRPRRTAPSPRSPPAGYHSCAIKTDGTPICWGENDDGQTTILAGTGTVTQISAGGYHTCAIKTDGNPTCWGDNFLGHQTVIPAGRAP